MTRTCIAPEDFGTIHELPEDDPARRHLQECTRCQARFRMFESFLQGQPPPAIAQPGRSRPVLDALIDREFQPPRSVGRATNPWWSRWRLRLLILTPAACAVFALALHLAPSERNLDGRGVMRGDESLPTFHLEKPVLLPDGSVRLAWRSVAGATGYRVSLFSKDLTLLHETPLLTDTTAVLDARNLGAFGGPVHVWRVTAYRGDEILLLSNVGTIHSTVR